MGTLVFDEQPKLQFDEPPPERGWVDTLRDVRETLNASTRGIVTGIPIVGPMLDRATDVAAAAPSAVTGNYGKAYNELRAEGERLRAEHPVASTVGEVAGSVVSGVPAARAFPRVFGGATLPGQMAAGGAIGGADAFVRSGGDPDAIKTGAIIGGAAPVIGSILAPVGQGIASAARWAGDKVPGVKSVIAPAIRPMSTEAIGDAAEQGYQTLSRGVKYDPQSLDDLTSLIKRDLYDKGKSGQIGAKQVHEVLDTLRSLPPTPASLHTVRKALNDIKGGDEGASARYARDIIDHFFESPPSNAVLADPRNASTVHARLQQANADYQAYKQSSELRDRVAKAQVDASSALGGIPLLAEGQAVRKNVKNWLNNKNQSRFVTPEQREALAGVVAPQSIGEAALRTAGALTGTGRVGALTGPALAALGFSTGGTGVLPTLAIGAGGAAASAAQSALTRRAVNYADDVIRASSPSAQFDMMKQLPPRLSMSPSVANMPASITSKAHRDEIARLLALQGQRELTEPKPRRIIMDTTNWGQ